MFVHRLILFCWALFHSFVTTWAFILPARRFARTSTQWASPKDDDEENLHHPGMEDAFRKLDALDSLGDDMKVPDLPTPEKKIEAKVDGTLESAAPVSPEQEIKVYQEMVSELEQNEDSEAYKEMMDDMGGSTKQTDDTYSEVLVDLGGRPKEKKSAQPQAASPAAKDDVPSTELIDQLVDQVTPKTTEEFMEEALQEAISEVKLNNPKITEKILDDKEIMKEIEEIFEAGNERLMESLEEIRREQSELNTASATASAQVTVDQIRDDVQRLNRAEASMQKQLDTVEKEQRSVELAQKELQAANQLIQDDFLVKLKAGGIPKQSAFAGLLLFAARSIVDTATALSSNDPSYLQTGLIQGGIALVCAIVFFVS